MNKKEIIRRGLMSKPRCYVGYYGVLDSTKHCFKCAFDGTGFRAGATDVVKVKFQKTFIGDIATAIRELSASNGSRFIGMFGNCALFYMARGNENKAGSD